MAEKQCNLVKNGGVGITVKSYTVSLGSTMGIAGGTNNARYGDINLSTDIALYGKVIGLSVYGSGVPGFAGLTDFEPSTARVMIPASNVTSATLRVSYSKS